MEDQDTLDKPSKKPAGPETKIKPGQLNESFGQNQNDLSDFNKRFIETKKKNQKFAAKLSTWSSISNENITKIRRAGLNQAENNNDNLKKHTLLSSSFLEFEQNKENISYTVDFKGNNLAEKYIGIGDLLPPHVESVMVIDDNGNIVSKNATRGINNRSRIGYYDNETKEYVSVHTGYRIVVLKTRTDSGEKSTIADTALERRKLSEQIELFENKTINIDREDEHTGADNKKPPSENPLHIPVKPAETKSVIKTKELRGKGYKPLKDRVPSKITRQAVRCLKKGGPIGTTFEYEINGRKYAFHREWHKHPSSDRRPDGNRLPAALYRQHHGITVYELSA